MTGLGDDAQPEGVAKATWSEDPLKGLGAMADSADLAAELSPRTAAATIPKIHDKLQENEHHFIFSSSS